MWAFKSLKNVCSKNELEFANIGEPLTLEFTIIVVVMSKDDWGIYIKENLFFWADILAEIGTAE